MTDVEFEALGHFLVRDVIEVGPVEGVGVLRQRRILLQKLVVSLLGEVELGALEDARPVVWQDERVLLLPLLLAKAGLVLGKHELVIPTGLGGRCNVVVERLLGGETVAGLVDHLSAG